MDTGIDIDHPDFGGYGINGSTAFPTARVTTGYDFVGDAYNADPASARATTRTRRRIRTRTTAPATARTWRASSAPTARVKGVAPERDVRRLPRVRLRGLDRLPTS